MPSTTSCLAFLASLFVVTISPTQQTATTTILNLISYGGVLHDADGKIMGKPGLMR